MVDIKNIHTLLNSTIGPLTKSNLIKIHSQELKIYDELNESISLFFNTLNKLQIDVKSNNKILSSMLNSLDSNFKEDMQEYQDRLEKLQCQRQKLFLEWFKLINESLSNNELKQSQTNIVPKTTQPHKKEEQNVNVATIKQTQPNQTYSYEEIIKLSEDAKSFVDSFKTINKLEQDFVAY